jgi:hypothetical protein
MRVTIFLYFVGRDSVDIRIDTHWKMTIRGNEFNSFKSIDYLIDIEN